MPDVRVISFLDADSALFQSSDRAPSPQPIVHQHTTDVRDVKRRAKYQVDQAPIVQVGRGCTWK